MDIKLRARLSAYSKIESVGGVSSNLPDPSLGSVGSVVGIGDTGKYTLFPTVNNNEIDELFDGLPSNTTVTKEEIDQLFTPVEKPAAVTKSEIDSLFDSTDDPEAITKDDIDTLFVSGSSNPTIGTVTYAEIDSLFN